MKSSSETEKRSATELVRGQSEVSRPESGQLSFPDALSATIERIRVKREERVRTAPRCAVCGESILADEPSGSPCIEQWTLYNATHDKLCFKHFQAEYQKLKLRWRLEDADKRLIAAGVSEEFSNRSFENYVLTDSNRQFFTAVKNWSQTPRYFLAILSPHTGIGKTHLAIAALRQYYITSAILGRFRKERDILLDIRKGYNTYGSLSESEAIESLSKPEFLVINDLFSSNEELTRELIASQTATILVAFQTTTESEKGKPT